MTGEAGRLRLDPPGAWIETRLWPGVGHTVFVLLHEGLGSAQLWRGFPEALANRTDCPVFAYSRLGYGASDPCALPRPLDYMEQEAAGPLAQVLDHARDAAGAEKIILIGHSDGASIAALYAGYSDDPCLAGVVLMAPHFFVEDVSLTSTQAAGAAYRSGDLRDRLARHHAHVDAAFRGWHDAWLDPGFRSWDITGCLTPIKPPILAIQGKNDPYGTETQVRAISEHAKTRTDIHLLEDCRHAPHLEQPEATLRVIAEFAAGLPDFG